MLQKQRMTGKNLLEIVTKNSIAIGCLLFVISYCLLFVVWYHLLYAMRYLVLHAHII